MFNCSGGSAGPTTASRADPVINKDINADVVVGDLKSDKVGSGARKNSGKPDYGLLPLMVILDAGVRLGSLCERGAEEVIRELAKWQRSGETNYLESSLEWCAVDSGNLETFEPAVRVLEYGKGKYAPWNWAKGMPWSVPFACAIRHLLAIQRGEETDPESGCSHWGHVVCNILMLLLFVEQYPELNDMPFGVLKQPCSI